MEPWKAARTSGHGAGHSPHGDRYLMYVARNVGAQPRADINLVWTKSLNPESPDYPWVEAGVVAGSDGVEDCNAIDPGLLLDPTGRSALDGLRIVLRFHPVDGTRPPDRTASFAGNASREPRGELRSRDPDPSRGLVLSLATHGSCCRGAESGYNIRMGRSRKITGPYLDHTGLDMIRGGGTLFDGSSSRHIGPGHFGLLDLGDGVQRFSCHYEADLDRGGASVLDIRPLLWKDGWRGRRELRPGHLPDGPIAPAPLWSSRCRA